jgi:hypothetical protein
MPVGDQIIVAVALPHEARRGGECEFVKERDDRDRRKRQTIKRHVIPNVPHDPFMRDDTLFLWEMRNALCAVSVPCR